MEAIKMRNGWRSILPALLIPILFGMHTVDAAARETITISSGQTVEDVVSFGKDIRVYGTVDGDAVVFGGDVYVESSGCVEGDAVYNEF